MLLGLDHAELSVLFVGSARMKALNLEYRNIPRDTDVLSFSMNEGQPFPPHASRVTRSFSRYAVLGDIVICVPRAMDQALEYGVSFDQELLRLLIHGLLHLTGHDHEKNLSERLRMEKKERKILNALAPLD